jgi:ribosomal-protein-alanine N-acetyltransferase
MTIDAVFTHFPFLTTNRLQLRQIQPDDAEALFATFSDEEVMRLSGQEPHRSLSETRQYIEQTQARYGQREIIRWGITRKDEEQVIGMCSLHHFDPGFHCAETAYGLNRTFWGQGVMTEAMSAILTCGFSELGLHRVEAVVASANQPSKKLLLKLRFTYEGNLRQRYFFRDHFEDEHYFGLLKDDWQGIV